MDEEALQELNQILQPIVDRSYQAAKRRSLHGIPSEHAILENMRMEIDNTRIALSNQFHKIDLVMQGNQQEYTYVNPFKEKQEPRVNERDYVQEINGGYQVYNGVQWVQLSNEAKIKLTLETSWETNDKLGVILKAEDPKTNTYVAYVDNDVQQPGFDYSYTGGNLGNGDVNSGLPARDLYWEDPYYNSIKLGSAITGKTAGALSARQLGNLTRWRTGSDLQYARGWYRNKEGIYRKLSGQKGVGAGGHQIGARNAAKRASKFAKVGRKFLYVSIAISIHQIGESLYYEDSNTNEVITKASIDIMMGLAGTFGGPIGWIVAGTYFVLDVSGVFGDWGEPSGVRADGVPYNTNQFDYGHELDFEIDYIPNIKEKMEQQLRESRQVEIDKTYVAPKRILFEKF